MGKYSIQLASKMSGVGVHTLRAWEKRYQAVVPERTASGRRVYSDNDVEKLRLLNELCSLGSSISTVASLSVDQLQETLDKLGVRPTPYTQASDPQTPTEGVVAKEVLQSLLLGLEAYKLDIISHEFEKLKSALSPKDLALEVLLPLLREVGARVANGNFSVAQEHAFSSIVKFHVGQVLYSQMNVRPSRHSSIALATPEGDYHEFGILVSALLCCHYGIKFYYFGPNLPAKSFAEAAQSVNADHLVLGTVEMTQLSSGLDLNTYIFDLIHSIKDSQRLLVGGSGYFSLDKFKGEKNFSYLPTIHYLDEFLKGL